MNLDRRTFLKLAGAAAVTVALPVSLLSSPAPRLDDGEWHHLALVVGESGPPDLYVDGSLYIDVSQGSGALYVKKPNGWEVVA